LFLAVPNLTCFDAGTRHLKSLLLMAEILETKAEMGSADNVIQECVCLLERKIELLREIHGIN
jgi:hypothetical protein